MFPEPLKCFPIWIRGYAIEEKIFDLNGVKKTVIDSLHKEWKPQKMNDERAGCSQSAASKHNNGEG